MIKKISKMHQHALEQLLWKKVLLLGGSNPQPLGYEYGMLPLSHSAYLQILGFFKHYFTLLQNEFVLITDFLCKFYKEFYLIAIYQMFQ